MNKLTIQNLNYFVNKICTIFVVGIQRQFDAQQFNDYFIGRVDSINEDGIMTTHPITGCKNYYGMNNVVGICEEQFLDPTNPSDAEIINEIKKKNVKSEGTLTDLNFLTQLQEQAGN